MRFSLRLELPSDPQLMSVVRGAVRQIAAVQGFAEAECRAITVGVDEAVTNVIRHAYGNRHDQSIVLNCSGDDESLVFVLEDQGRPADPAGFKGRVLEDIGPGGMGTHIIRKTMDLVEYQRLPDRNRLRLVKFLDKRPLKEQL